MTEVSEQLAKQINSAISAKNEDLEREEERKRLKKSRSHSTPGHGISTTQSKHLRRLHAKAIADSIQEDPELVNESNKMEDMLGVTAISDVYSDNMQAMARDDVGTVRGFQGVSSEEPNLESDLAEILEGEQKGSTSLSTFSRISDIVKVVNRKTSDKGHHDVLANGDSSYDDQEVPYKTLSVSTTSRTFNRDTLGALNPLPRMPILGSSNSAANKDMMS